MPGFRIISPFGLRQLPWERAPRLHAGVDIAAPAGAAVLAVRDGVVVRVGVDAGYGRFVELEHEQGLRSFYAHLQAFAEGLARGDKVRGGEVLGRVGSTGFSTGAHLHLELRSAQGQPLDPFFFLGRPFASTGEWPILVAARVSPHVRYAQAASTPEAVQELLIAQAELDTLDLPMDQAAGDAASKGAASGSEARAASPAFDASTDSAAAPDPGPPGEATLSEASQVLPVTLVDVPPEPPKRLRRPLSAFPSAF